MLKNIAGTLLILVATISLTGCSFFTGEMKVTFDPTCEWFEDQSATKEVREWFKEHAHGEEIPHMVQQYLLKVKQNKDLGIRNCSHLQ